MKATKLPILILTFIFSTPFAHAQFNTIGYVKKHHVLKKKSPQETIDAAPVDSVMKSDSLSKASSQSILPYLKASLPLKSIRINSKYGMLKHPVMHKTIMHNGVDLAATIETVFSMFPGVVKNVSQDSRSGKYVIIQTGNYTISYCHLSYQAVLMGQIVNAGTPIGVAGCSGLATGIHLHLGAKYKGKSFDPELLFNYVKSLK